MGYQTRMRHLVFVVLAACGSPMSEHQSTEPVSADSYIDKVTIGYQAWFAAAGDGSTLNEWYHWGHGMPAAGNVTFELYPDVRDYAPADLHTAGFAPLGNGQPAQLFGSWSDGVIDTHFQWLEDNGLDGVGLQRFVVALYDPRHLEQRNEITRKVRAAAEQHGRIFYIEYDISGANEATWADDIQADFTNVMQQQLDVFSSPQYAHQDGKPVVAVWGFGFPDRPGDGARSLALIQWLKAQGVYVIGGVPYNWRTGDNVKPGFEQAFAALDLVQPWAVGTVSTDADVDSHFQSIVSADEQLAHSRGQAYQRVIFPGFAWSNWNGGTRNMIPRRAGGLFWRQAYQAARTHTSVFVAMLDEYDEGTAIGKAAEDVSMIPSDQYFLTLDADGQHVSSDFYLRLAGAATRMLHGDAPLTDTIPIAAGGTASSVPAQQPAPQATVRAFTSTDVQRLYRAVLGRDADPSGLAAYTPLAEQGEIATVIDALYGSPEFDARRSSLTLASLSNALYVELLGRSPDPGGDDATRQAIAAGQAPQRTLDIVLSPEYAARQ